MSKPVWITPSGFLGTVTERVSTSTSVIASSATSYTIISGEVPPGLIFTSNGNLAGIPFSVGETERHQFVVRARNNEGISDRTFIMDVIGPTAPFWETQIGYLPVGISGENYAVNKQFVDYQLEAIYDALPTGQKLRYYIADEDGTLPTGLILTEDGRITGQINVDLSVNYLVSKTGGYDTESYDGYPYDHALIIDGNIVIQQIDNITRIFQFYVTVSNGVANSKRLFKIEVRVPTDLVKPQWRSPYYLGTVRANNTQIIQLEYYDPYPTTGPVTFNWGFEKTLASIANTGSVSLVLSDVNLIKENMPIISLSNTGIDSYVTNINTITNTVTINSPVNTTATIGSKVLFDVVKNQDGSTSQHPSYFKLNTSTGVLYATLPYQTAYNKDYDFTVRMIKTKAGTTSTVVNNKTFKLIVKGEVENNIRFITTSSVGSLTPGEQSELAIIAEHENNPLSIQYKLISGDLPPGLTLGRDGSIQGKVSYGSGTYIDLEDYGYNKFLLDQGTTTIDKNYYFTVQATDAYLQSGIIKEFYISIEEGDLTEYTRLYAKPFLKQNQRDYFKEFLENSYVFDRSLLYRINDPNFGVQRDIKLFIEHGLEKTNIHNYFDAFWKYFYNKKFYFGDVKYAKANNNRGEYIYDVVYIDIIDTFQNEQKVSIPRSVITGNQTIKTVYPNSVENWRVSLESIKLLGEPIKTDEYHMPKFMRTIQDSEYIPLGFILALPLCYVTPGNGETVIKRIKINGFNFTNIDFEVDRLVVEDVLGQQGAKYLVFPRKTITDSLDNPNIIYTESNEFITNEDENPLLSEFLNANN